MPSLNKVLLMGNLTRDPELRKLPSGQSVAAFGLAVNRKGKRADGTEWEDVLFIDVEFFGGGGEAIHRWLGKGDPLFIEGRLQLSRWETTDGDKRSKIRVIGDQFQFLPRKSPAPGPVTVAGHGIIAAEAPF